MNFLLKTFRNLTAVVALLCWLSAAGASDFYVMELGQSAPASVDTMIITGLLLMVPMALHVLKLQLKGNRA